MPKDPASGPFDVFTIGHSNHPIGRFVALLKDAGATAAADVRSQPSSRRCPWFSANRLRERLEMEGIAYVPMGDALGGRPRDPALLRDGIADYEAMAAHGNFNTGIDRVMEGARRFRICLMCTEREPLDCHRCLLVAPALAARGLRVGHVLADGRIAAHDEIEAQLSRAGGGDLFLNDPTSRRGLPPADPGSGVPGKGVAPGQWALRRGCSCTNRTVRHSPARVGGDSVRSGR